MVEILEITNLFFSPLALPFFSSFLFCSMFMFLTESPKCLTFSFGVDTLDVLPDWIGRKWLWLYLTSRLTKDYI